MWPSPWLAWPGSAGWPPGAGSVAPWLSAGPSPIPIAPGAVRIRWSRGWIGWSRRDANWWMGCPGLARARGLGRAQPPPQPWLAPAWATWAAGWRTSSTGSWRTTTPGASPGRRPSPPASPPANLRTVPLDPALRGPGAARWRRFHAAASAPSPQPQIPPQPLPAKTGPTTPASPARAGSVQPSPQPVSPCRSSPSRPTPPGGPCPDPVAAASPD